MNATDYHRLVPTTNLRKLTAIVAKEAKTHRHLWPSEPLANGDIYGGEDWEFEFEIGTSSVQSPRAGDPCPESTYRYRRPLKAPGVTTA